LGHPLPYIHIQIIPATNWQHPLAAKHSEKTVKSIQFLFHVVCVANIIKSLKPLVFMPALYMLYLHMPVFQKRILIIFLCSSQQNILEAFSVFPYISLAAEICNEWLLTDAGVGEDDDILIGLYQKGWVCAIY